MNLVIVESPSKAKTINKYLGKEYKVLASKGHVVDLPKSSLGIDVDNDFKPEYIVTNKVSLTTIKRAFKECDKLILAVDLDREGEAIGWHIARELKIIDEKNKIKGKKPLERIVFSEISKDAINEAINSPRAIDINLVNSQQGRRLLDRIVGYKLSPLLWKKISFGLSAGRVQSVTLRLIVEKEEERNKFDKKEYWDVLVNLSKKKIANPDIVFQKIDKDNLDEAEDSKLEKSKDVIPFSLIKVDGKNPELKDVDITKKVVKGLEKEKWVISSIESKNEKRSTRPPFITSTLQQSGVNKLGFTSKRTMSAAQKLYEMGYITYMRTDSVVISNKALEEIRSYILKEIGQDYLPETSKGYKSKSSAQEAHECIRPVDVKKTSNDLSLDGDLKRVYDLIWQRTLASQMKEALFEVSNIDIKVSNLIFRSNGRKVLFDGYLKVYNEVLNEVILPKLNIGDELFLESLISSQHFTQPPARYSEASLIKKLEELGIGRPSTYSSIISTILARKYVEKEGKYLYPTDIGIAVNSLLVKYFGNIVDYDFTAKMEDDLDKVASGKMDWVKMLKDFYFPLVSQIKEKEESLKRDEFKVLGKSDKKCPTCGKEMIIKLGRYGRFYSCVDFPKCDGMLPYEGKDNKNETFDPVRYESAPKAEDGRDYIVKVGRFGSFWAHPDYPKVKDAKPLVLKREFLIELYGEPPVTDDKREYLLKKGKFGFFWAHPDYPAVKDIVRIKKPAKS